MADFQIALGPTLQREGGWVHVDGDTGEETYRGISRANFPKWGGWRKIDTWKLCVHKDPDRGQIFTNAAIPGIEEDVQSFYLQNFWNTIRGNEIINQEVASDLFDKAVNMGTHQAIVLSQRSLEIAETGKMDDITLVKLNEMNPYA